MKGTASVLMLALVVAVLAPAGRAQSDAVGSTDMQWPREVQGDGGEKITVYQPQVESWSGNRIEMRAAVAVESAASPTPTYGVVWVTARTAVNKAQRVVTLQALQIKKVNFPAGDRDYAALLQEHLPATAPHVALDRLEASLTVSGAERQTHAVPLKNEPPRIIFAVDPSVLVLVDGDAVLRDVPQSNLLRVINTRALLVLDKKQGQYYVYVADRWYQSSTLDSTWSPASDPPPSLDTVKAAAVKQHEVSLYDDPGPAAKTLLAQGGTPSIYVSITAASLIETDGRPEWAPISGTQLLYVSNTSSTVIRDIRNQSVYVLLSGRWFAAASTDGPWKYVANNEVPADFAMIPETHPKGAALVSVSGTQQAQEAVIASDIPQTASVSRSVAQLTVVYDGKPKLKKVSGTSMRYVVNTPTPVIEVSRRKYYACSNGVWFRAAAPTGPWVAAVEVPGVIYTIPVSSPIHYVTYVHVYGSTPDVIYVGYTPGYYGTYVSPYGVVVYGSGYVYPPYVGTVWIGPPPTYGFGAGFAWGAATGFALGYAGGAWCNPYWGPAGWGRGWGYANVNINVNNVHIGHAYDNWDHGAVVAHSGDVWAGHAGNTTVVGKKGGNIYADHNGNVYRRQDGTWQKMDNGGWNTLSNQTRDPARQENTPRKRDNNGMFGRGEGGDDRFGDLDREAWSRDRGDRRFDDFRRNDSFNRGNFGRFDGDRSGRGNFGGRGFGGRGFGGFHGGGRGRR